MVHVIRLDPRDGERVRKGVIDRPQALVNFMRLAPGERLPRHAANADLVCFVPLHGDGSFEFDGAAHRLSAGQIAAVSRGTEMDIRNDGGEALDFIVIKTPNPGNT